MLISQYDYRFIIHAYVGQIDSKNIVTDRIILWLSQSIQHNQFIILIVL